jgi:CRP/FNR family transcriptional regulator, polysaccharide utilization system transcription regulator
MNTILLIEDDADLRDKTCRILMQAGYHVIKAENGRVGLDYIEKNKKNLSMILCGVTMPELDGYSVFQAYKTMPEMKHVPFVFTGDKIENEHARKLANIAAGDFLVKPYSSSELLSLIAARFEITDSKKQYPDEFVNILFKETVLNNKEHFKNRYQVKTIPRHNMLFMEGDKSFYIYYIIKGMVKIFKTNELGKEYITNIYTHGNFFGYSAFLNNEMHNDSAMVLEDSEIVKFSRNDFFELILDNREACLKIMQDLSLLLNKSEEKLVRLAYNSARKKVAEAVLFIAKKYASNSTGNFSFPVSRNDLSAISGISPESVSRNLTDFRKEGLIEAENGHIVILNMSKLEGLKN